MGRPLLGVSLQPDRACAAVVAPLLAGGRVEAVEWTVDAALPRGLDALPAWFRTVLERFAAAGRLYAHGVGLSGMSGASTTPRQQLWFDAVAGLQERLPARRLSVHAGWSTAGPVVFGPPLSPPPSSVRAQWVLADRLRRLSQRVAVPVGVENLGFAWGPSDVRARPAHWHTRRRSGVRPYLHLDLHNLWCQAATWSLPWNDLLQALPTDSVRVIHIAGGRWSSPVAGQPPVRRDTHDGPVPEAVWEMLDAALDSCPGAEVVFYERIVGAWGDQSAITAELDRLGAVLDAPRPSTRQVAAPSPAWPMITDSATELHAWQVAVLDAPTPDALLQVLQSTEPYTADFRDLDVRMVHVAQELIGRWSRRA